MCVTGFVAVLIEIVTGFVCLTEILAWQVFWPRKEEKKNINYSHVLNVATGSILGYQPGSYSRTFQTRPKVMVLGRVQNVAQGEYCSRV